MRITAMALAVLFAHASVASADQLPAGNCDTGSINPPYSGCTLSQAYCEGTMGATGVLAAGTPTWLTDEHHCDNCTDNCDDTDESNDPPPINCETTLTVEHSHDFSWSSGLSVEAGADVWLLSVKGTLEGEIGGSDEETVTSSHTVGPDPMPACQWGSYYAKMQVIEGKSVKVAYTLQPTVIWNCNGNSLTGSGQTTSGQATMTGDVAIESSGTSGTSDNGNCPPEPPFDTGVGE